MHLRVPLKITDPRILKTDICVCVCVCVRACVRACVCVCVCVVKISRYQAILK